MKRALIAVATAAALTLTAAGCGSGDDDAPAVSPSDPTKISGALTVLTNRTDLVTDGTMKKYADEFNKTYPNVQVKFETSTNYEGETKTRMNTKEYGDVLFIPNNVSKADYPTFFASLGKEADLSKKYQFTANGSLNGETYGLASLGATNGFLYNKDVWTQAGITTWPKSTDEFLANLATIKEKTKATPYYTNYKDGWPLTSWSNFNGNVSCDVEADNKLAQTDDPWAAGTDLNATDTLLFNIVSRKLSEPDPTTTNWENSKNLMGGGKVATMMLGSWAISQMQDAAKKAGKSADSIGFMPFPGQPNGKYCADKRPDYLYGVNINSTSKDAARAWIDFMIDKSGFAEANQAISAVQGKPLPPGLKPYEEQGVQFIELSQTDRAKVTEIDKASEVGLTSPDYRQHLIDVARGSAKGSLESEFKALATKWANGRQEVG